MPETRVRAIFLKRRPWHPVSGLFAQLWRHVSYDLHRRLAVDCSVGRYYDPATGQFLSVDPEVEQTLEAYQYVGDDPVNATDALGLGCGWNPFCYAAKAYDVLNEALNTALAWMRTQVNTGICVVFTSNRTLAGFLRTQANCPSPSETLTQRLPGTAVLGTLNPKDLVRMEESYLKQLKLNPEKIKQEIVGDRGSQYDIFRDKTNGDLYVGPKSGGPAVEYQPVWIRVRGRSWDYFTPKEFNDLEGGGFDVVE